MKTGEYKPHRRNSLHLGTVSLNNGDRRWALTLAGWQPRCCLMSSETSQVRAPGTRESALGFHNTINRGLKGGAFTAFLLKFLGRELELTAKEFTKPHSVDHMCVLQVKSNSELQHRCLVLCLGADLCMLPAQPDLIRSTGA